MDIYKALGEERPEWHEKAACRGMKDAFWNASSEVQKQICKGTIAPWAKPCPVQSECLEGFVSNVIFNSTVEEASYNTLVHGGYDPHELLAITKKVRKELKNNESSTVLPSV